MRLLYGSCTFLENVQDGMQVAVPASFYVSIKHTPNSSISMAARNCPSIISLDDRRLTACVQRLSLSLCFPV